MNSPHLEPTVDRRSFLSRLSAGAALAGFCAGSRGGRAAESREEPVENSGSKPIHITKVRMILTDTQGIATGVVKVETSEPGLYGVGCATFKPGILAVQTAVDRYLDPFLRGKDPAHIEDLWQASFQSSYWRNGPVLMNALSGVDSALWDIKGKRVGLPVYQLLGGKCRVACPAYSHAGGSTPEEAATSIQRLVEKGYRYVRCQVSVPRHDVYGPDTRVAKLRKGHFAGNSHRSSPYVKAVPRVFEGVRKILGDDVELLHDVHERLHPIQAIQVAKDLEPYRLFFLEDPFAPEDIGYFEHLRAQTSTPIAMGELFNNPNEYVDIISGRLIDFIRCHISQIGGISAARKIANLCDFFRVRTAWHGPGDTSPVGHAANCHLDLATWNFGIQEFVEFSDRTREVFPGMPEIHDGMIYVNEAPGLGVDIDEKLAAKYPFTKEPPWDPSWGYFRGVDGTIRRP